MLFHIQFVALIALSLASAGWADVDTSRPDLSVYKLRRVDTRRLALERAQRPIVELETGAEHMRESLYTTSRQVRCPAYAHLFRLIKSSHGSEGRILQATVEALAVVVTNDRVFYFDLLTRQPDYLSAAGKHFMEAIESLEQRQLSEADAYLDLMGCLRDFMLQSSPEVPKFLAKPSRAKRLAVVAQFKAIPLETTPERMVEGLVDRIERGKPAEMSALDFRQAQELIESLDDQLVASFRQSNKLHEQTSAANEEEEEEEEEEESSGAEGQGQTSPASAIPPSPLDLVVPVEGADSSSISSSFDASRLAILKFIKMRLEQAPWSRWHKPPRLSMRLAFDFRTHWQDLMAFQPASPTKLGQLAIEFRQDPRNVQLAKRVELAITIYEELLKVLEGMQDQHLEELEELERPLDKLGKLLASMDASFDVDDIRRLNEIWRAKFQEYSTVDKFINGAFW